MKIEHVLEDLNIPFKRAGEHEHVSEGWLGVDCPRCTPDAGHYRLGINIRGVYSFCWSCGYLPLVRTLAEAAGKHSREILRLTRHLLRGRAEPLPDKRGPSGSVICKMPGGVGPLLPPHRRYLRSRGFDPAAIAEAWGVKGVGPAGGKLAWSVWIPVHLNGRLVSWTCRSVGRAGWRYRSADRGSEVYPHHEVLYGADAVPGNSVVVVEGPIDVWAVGPGAVATFGTAYSQAQVRRIAKFPVRAVCYDSTGEGRAAGRRLAGELELYPGMTYLVTLAGGKDAAASPDEAKKLRRRFLT